MKVRLRCALRKPTTWKVTDFLLRSASLFTALVMTAMAHSTRHYLMLFYPAIDIVLLGLSEGQLNKAMLTYGLRHRVRLHEFLMVFL